MSAIEILPIIAYAKSKALTNASCMKCYRRNNLNKASAQHICAVVNVGKITFNYYLVSNLGVVIYAENDV